jgi:hypothetical protein
VWSLLVRTLYEARILSSCQFMDVHRSWLTLFHS